MYFLPKLNPLYERIPTNKLHVLELLIKLGKGQFSGYLIQTAPGFEAYCIFTKGKLICAISNEGSQTKTGFEAIAQQFEKVFSANGEISVFRMTAALAMCTHALLLGTKVVNGEEVRQIDIKNLLTRIRNQGINGIVRFYTDERFAIIFYKNGLPIGFYRDGLSDIETSPNETRSIATLPGARIEVRFTKPVEELMLYDLLKMVNLHKLWDAASTQRTSVHAEIASVPDNGTSNQISLSMGQNYAKLADLVEDLQDVAVAYLSKEGRVLINKCIDEAGGSAALLDNNKSAEILKKFENGAKEMDCSARIQEMIDLMRSEITERLAV